MTVTVDEERLKEILKQAIVEVVEERQSVFYDLVEEILEDIAMARAIEEGMGSEFVSRDEVFHALEGMS